MPFLDDLTACFDRLDQPTPAELRQAILGLDADLQKLTPYLGDPGIYPYGRQPLYSANGLEAIVMNWASGRECAPHDHGRSFGWIQLVSGTLGHTLYTLDQRDVPVAFAHRIERTGNLLFAPRGAIHSMAGTSPDRPTVTLHVYAPPISEMVVYDLERCAACVVSDDCGAWWPDEQRQRLLEIDLRRRPPARHSLSVGSGARA